MLREEGLRVSPGELEPGDDHDGPGLRRRHVRRAHHPRGGRAAIIAAERPDALLPTLGGQTALNTAIALYEDGTCSSEYGVELIGANVDAIRLGEDREAFKDVVRSSAAAADVPPAA